MNIDIIKEKIIKYKTDNKRIFATSSFQTQSLVLLHIISRIDNNIPIYFINTGYHFAETIKFKNFISKEFNLNVYNISSNIPKSLQKDSSGNLLFTSDPDYCCYINKVQPVEMLLKSMDIWINGVRASQNETRKLLKEEQPSVNNTVRYHPLLNWSDKIIDEYIKLYKIPYHPLENKGYSSIGCEPCTVKKFNNSSREARWYGMNKNECGLNVELIENK